MKKFESFINTGFVKLVLEKKSLNKISTFVKNKLKKKLKLKSIPKNQKLFEDLGNYLNIEKLNEVRLSIYNDLNNQSWLTKSILSLCQKDLEFFIGTEIAMQKKINFSIQLPNDDTSLLGAHGDYFSGESFFQINLWFPLSNVKKTSSMFVYSVNDSIKIFTAIKNNKVKNLDLYLKKFKKNFIEVKYGEGLIFSPNLLHGNQINKEKNARVSFNIRFKNLFSPYNNYKGSEKKLGQFYDPITPKLATKFAIKNGFIGH